MSPSDPPDDDPLDAAPFSRESITPRGGFMARPGLKAPPRHAVVVRVGDAPQDEHIPLLRSSVPPPPPASEPPVPSASERVTLRAIPTPVSSRAAAPAATSATGEPAAEPLRTPALDSPPPPSHAPLSDAPLVSNLVEQSGAPESQRGGGSRWTIVIAAAAGVLLGLGSVAARLYASRAASQPELASTLSQPAASSPAPVLASTPAAPRRVPSGTPGSERTTGELKSPARTPAPSAKRSIF